MAYELNLIDPQMQTADDTVISNPHWSASDWYGPGRVSILCHVNVIFGWAGLEAKTLTTSLTKTTGRHNDGPDNDSQRVACRCVAGGKTPTGHSL